MIEAVVAQALQATLPSAAPATPALSAAPDRVQPGAAARFAELMAAGAPPSTKAPVAEAVARAFPPPVAVGSSGLGEDILRGLNAMQNDFGHSVQRVSRALDAVGPAPNAQELLRLQLAMTELSVQVELAGKAIGRATQNIDQLVRMQ